MSLPCFKLTRGAVVIALVFGTLSLPAAAFAQSTSAVADTIYTIDLPSQPLGDALNELAQQANLQLLVRRELVEGKRAPAVTGRFTAEQALQRLLVNSGLIASTQGASVVIQADSPQQAASRLPSVTVAAEAEELPGELPKAYAGGQVARGGRIGLLGEKDILDTPFSTTNFTSEYIADRQARTVADVLAGDPLASPSSNRFQGLSFFQIRGFLVNSAFSNFNGLNGLAPSGNNLVIGLERLEVLRGPSSLLTSINSSLGGTLNYVPKRAPDAGVKQLTLGYQSETTAYLHADVGQRFGEDNEWGVRANAIYLDGKTPISGQTERMPAATFAIDYRGERHRASVDLIYQTQETTPNLLPPSIAAGFEVPKAPKASRSFYQPWQRLAYEEYVATGRFEYDISPSMTAFAGYGKRDEQRDVLSANSRIVNAQGDLSQSPFYSKGRNDINSGEFGLRGQFNTGMLSHEWVAVMNDFSRIGTSSFIAQGTVQSNIYDPIAAPAPARIDAPLPRTEEKFRSFALANTISAFDDRLQVTLGLRQQNVKTRNLDNANVTPYDESALTPSLGVVFKPTTQTAVYANYIEGLQQGPIAPDTANNRGQAFPPTKNKQVELGVKGDWNGFGAQASVFDIRRVTGQTDNNSNEFGIIGEQRNRGIELLVFGEPRKGLRLLGGLTLLDAFLNKTSDEAIRGNDIPGAAPRSLALSAEWDVSHVQGLSLNGRVNYVSSQVIDNANLQTIPAWQRYDIGASYRMVGPNRKPLVLRASLENLTDRSQWVGTNGFGSLVLGTPRTLLVSATLNF